MKSINKFVTMKVIGISMLLLFIFPISYWLNEEKPLGFLPYGVVLMLITILYMLVACTDDNCIFNFGKKLNYYLISKRDENSINNILTRLLAAFIVFFIYVTTKYPYNDISATAAIMLISIICAYLTMFYGGGIQGFKTKAKFLFYSFVFSCIVWIILSYGSYYTGVEFGARQAANIVQKQVASIILNEESEAGRKEKISQFLNSANAIPSLRGIGLVKIEIEKNGSLFLEYQPKDRPGYFLTQNLIEPLKGNPPVDAIRDASGNDYRVYYKFYNKPILWGDLRSWLGLAPKHWGGLAKAIFFSANTTNNKSYFDYSAYLRSIHLWWIFWILSAAFFFALNIYQNKERAYKQVQKALADLEDQKMILDEMRKDFNFYVNDSLNDLQPIHSSINRLGQKDVEFKRHNIINDFRELQKWGPEELEKVAGYDERVEKYVRFLNFMEHEYYQKEYDTEQRWSFLEDTYNIVISPWTKEIHEKLRKLDHIFEVSNKDVTVKEIVDKVTSKETIKKVPCDINIASTLTKEATCRVIPGKLQDMVYNLLANSSHVGSLYGMKVRRESRGKVRFEKKIVLNIDEIQEKGKTYLTIEVRDNCGGFPEDIKDKIYVEPVPSIKDEGKKDKTNSGHGRGTYLIGFFARMMDILIEKDNVTYPDGQKGASTILKIPYL